MGMAGAMLEMLETMETFGKINELRAFVGDVRRRGLPVSFVPTMGALHDGHRACIETARDLGGVVIVSIFVNPTQFDEGEDLDKYPATLERDLEVCRGLAVGAVFVPDAAEMYPIPQSVWVEVERCTEPLCGRTRMGHFRGVATVVAKLFNIVTPDVAVFGQKDAQQAVVINLMVQQLDFPVRIVFTPTVRDPDGLALSSRNRYLAAGDRERAASIYQALLAGKETLMRGERNARAVTGAVRARLVGGGIDDIEYIELVDARTLRAPGEVPAGRDNSTTGAAVAGTGDHGGAGRLGPLLLAVAVRIGATRLIDNLVLEVDADGDVTDAMLL